MCYSGYRVGASSEISICDRVGTVLFFLHRLQRRLVIRVVVANYLCEIRYSTNSHCTLGYFL